MSEDVKYPEVSVQLVGEDGNALAILGKVQRALIKHLTRERGMTHAEAKDISNKYMDEATMGDYDTLLAVTMSWVNVE